MAKTKIIFLCLLCWLTTGEVMGQRKWSCKLLCAVDSTTVAYAHIGFPSKGIGTISNLNGRFSIFLPQKLQDTLIISHLNYESKLIKVGDVDAVADSIVYLFPKDYSVKQIQVMPKQRLHDIIKLAHKNIRKNYPRSLHYSTALYRELMNNTETNGCTRLYEAVVAIQDRSYTSALKNVKAQVLASRKSDDYTNRNVELKYRVMIKVFEKLFNSEKRSKDFYKLLYKNPVRNTLLQEKNNDGNRFWCKNVFDILLNAADLQLNRVIGKDDDKTFVIDYTYKGFMWYRGQVFIKEKDNAVTRLTLEEVNNLEDANEKVRYRNVIEFRKYGKYYFPIYNERLTPDLKSVNGLKHQLLIYLSNSDKRSEIEKIKRRNVLKASKDVYTVETQYDQCYWDSLNILKQEPLPIEVIRDLSMKKSLYTQFEDNGKTEGED